jgi:hypothetical protein
LAKSAYITPALISAGSTILDLTSHTDHTSAGLCREHAKCCNGQAERRLGVHAVIMREFGTAAVLRPGEFPDPAERPGWVTVALRASALNWHDVLVRQGRYGSPLPHVIGADGAGVRTDTGEHVVVLPSLNWGDRDEAPGTRWEILGDHTPGTYAELVSVPVDCLAAKPVGMNCPGRGPRCHSWE